MAREEKLNVCKNCAFAASRTEATRFKWCKYLCTLERPHDKRWIPYKYAEDSCEYFQITTKSEGVNDD